MLLYHNAQNIVDWHLDKCWFSYFYIKTAAFLFLIFFSLSQLIVAKADCSVLVSGKSKIYVNVMGKFSSMV